MSLQGEIEKKNRKNKRKRRNRKTIQTILYYTLGKCIVFPIENYKENRKERSIEKGLKNIEKTREKCIQEIIERLVDEIRRSGVVILYNASKNEDIDYGNSLAVRSFVGDRMSMWYVEDGRKQSIKYYRVLELKNKNKEDKRKEFDEDYNEIYELIQERLKEKYEDIKIKSCNRKIFEKEYEGVSIKLEK